MSVLERLRRAGVHVRADGPDVILRGRVTDDLAELARQWKPQLMADLDEETAMENLPYPPCSHPKPALAYRCSDCAEKMCRRV